MKTIKKIFIKIINLTAQIYKKVCFYIHRKLPLRKNIVFECESDMDDNPRAVYEYLIEQGYNKRHKLIWIVRNVELCKQKHAKKNVDFVSRFDYSFKNIIKLDYYLNTSNWFIFSHPSWFIKKRKTQVVVHINHGSGLKGIDQKGIFNSEVIDYLLVPSVFMTDKMMKFWNCPKEKIIYIGFPRMDLLFKGDKRELFNTIYDYNNNDKVVICMPTYKQSTRVEDSTIIDKYSLDFVKNEEELLYLNRQLKDKGVHLIIKVHPLQKMDSLYINSLSNVHYLTNKELFDYNIILYELIGKCDALITDLSSVYTDFLVLNRPVAFLMESISNYSRGFMEDPDAYMPGDKIYQMEDFIDFLDNLINGKDDYINERKRVFDYFHHNNKDNNCKAFCDWLFRNTGSKL